MCWAEHYPKSAAIGKICDITWAQATATSWCSFCVPLALRSSIKWIQDLSFVLRAARLQDTKNRQNSIESSDEDLALWWDSAQQEIIDLAQKHYARAIELGIAKEQARAILPEGNTVSKLYMNGTLRSWIHFIELRGANGTQKEHQEVAVACAQVIAQIFPIAADLVAK